MKTKRGFTLIELLTVIAITAILLAIITIPVIQSFNLTRTAQAFADAQDRARFLSERISREISNSAGVRDMSAVVRTTVNSTEQGVPAHTLAVQLPSVANDGTAQATDSPAMVDVLLPYSKVDILKPAEQPLRNEAGELVDPNTGKADPTLRAPKGPIVLPVAPGTTIVRWFIGRRDPFQPYQEPYSGLLQARSGRQDNLYVLYRAEVPIFDAAGNVDRNFFFDQSDDNSPATNGPLIDDPWFFEPARPFPNGGYVTGSGASKQEVVQNWKDRAVLVTELSRYDMIQPIFDRQSRRIANTNGLPHVVPLIQFRPTRVSNDPAAGQPLGRLGEEADNATAIGSDVFTTQYGLWSNAVVRIYPSTFIAGDTARNQYVVGRRDSLAGTAGRPSGFAVYGFDPESGVDDILGGIEIFDVAAYEQGSLARPNARPFSAAALAANDRTGWLANGALREVFVPFFTVPNRGRLYTSFGIAEVGVNTLSGDPSRPNLPLVATGDALTPTTDNGAGASFSGTGYQVNRAFNRVYNEFPNLRDSAQRFIDLRVTANEDGTLPPLYPAALPAQVTGFTTVANNRRNSRVRIVPGSETVVGPDQLPGPNFGSPIRYTRTTAEPGPNQYRINYVDLPEPTRYEDTFGAGVAEPPLDYDPANVVSAVLQPRFKAGYLQLNSDPNAAIPSGTFQINYRFQFTGGRTRDAAPDRVAVDYDSRQLMSVLLTIRNYPQSNVPNPQTVTIKSTATVRNYVR